MRRTKAERGALANRVLKAVRGSLPVQIGQAWFKWRSFSPIPLFLLYFLLKPDFSLSTGQYVIVILALALAECIRIWAVGYAGSRTRTRGDTVIELIHSGPFRYVRNPLYIANTLLYSLAGVCFGFSTLSLVVFVYSALQYSFIVRYEESVLERDIGEPYLNYKKAVPRWFPSFVPCIQSSRHTFQFNQALRSERSTFYSITAMVLLYFLKLRVNGWN